MRESRWLTVALVLLYIFLLGPFLVIFIAAFGADSTLAFPPRGGFTLYWFYNVFNTSQFVSSFWISLGIALMATGIALVLGIPVAYALVNFRFPGQGLLETDLLVAGPGAGVGHRLCHAAVFRVIGRF